MNLARPYRLGPSQTVAFTATAGTIANPIGSMTNVVRVVASSAAFIRVDNNPTATTSDAYIAAGIPEYIICTPGQKVSAVQVSAGGNLYVTECSG